MSAFVLDCSVAVAWLFDDEATPETDALLDRLKDDDADFSPRGLNQEAPPSATA